MSEKIVILCERLTPEEEVVFLRDVNDAVDAGELTAQEAADMIDREYALMAQAK